MEPADFVIEVMALHAITCFQFLLPEMRNKNAPVTAADRKNENHVI